jgi:hypothetical protein
MAIPQWSPAQWLSQYALILARKIAIVAVGWLVVYFISQPMRTVPPNGDINILSLFGMVVGCFAGLLAGWYLANDAVEDSSLHGIVLWTLLVLGAVVPMWLIEALMHLITRWPLNFAGFLILTAATLMALASAVWYASTQE